MLTSLSLYVQDDKEARCVRSVDEVLSLSPPSETLTFYGLVCLWADATRCWP